MQTTKTTRTVRCDVYPSRLSDAALDQIQRFVFSTYDQAPTFSGWLVEVIQDEQVRRLERRPVERFGIPLNASGKWLSEALIVASALTYASVSPAMGKFADSLFHTVNALAASKLKGTK